MVTRPPASNLGPMAQPWANYIQDQTITNRDAIERLGGDASNDGRINNAQMDMLSGQVATIAQQNVDIQAQVDEINARAINVLPSPTLQSGTFTNGSDSTVVYRNITIPAPPNGARLGWLAVTASVSQTTTGGDSAAFIEFRMDGTAFHHASLPTPISGLNPPPWGDNASIAAFTSFDGAASHTLQLRISGRGFAMGGSNPTRRVQLTDILITYQYAQRA